ncbi:hypothetical protein C8F01DRAFT_1369177 [Mycena amicta]|nr:hypothetical protein C8F01DRAFT_1369177 [Mycena amicta]
MDAAPAPAQQQPLLPSTSTSTLPKYGAIHTTRTAHRTTSSRCALFLGSVVLLALLGGLLTVWTRRPSDIDRISDAIPDFLQAKRCLRGSPNPHEPSYIFALPLYQDTTLVVSRGTLSPPSGKEAHLGGHIRITTSADLPPHTAQVMVVPSSLGYATVCSLVPKAENDTSVSAFTIFATGPRRSHSPNINITLVLPAQTALRGLQTQLPNFAYDIDDLVGAGIDIEAAFITGGEKPIKAKSISGTRRLLLSTFNAYIHADLARSDVLDVSTGTSDDSTLRNASITGAYTGGSIRLITGNSPIAARILLESDDTDTVTQVDAWTSHAPVDIHVAVATPWVRLQAVTSNAPANVVLPPTYEGTFAVYGGEVQVQEPGREDARTLRYSSGKEAALETENGNGHRQTTKEITGAIYLEEENVRRGWVSVHSEGGKAVVVL